MSDIVLDPAPLHIAQTGTRMVWRQLAGSKTEQGVIGPVEPDLLVHYLWEGRSRSMYFFCIGCAGENVRFDHAAYESLFPLEVGKTVTFQRTVDQWTLTNTITVSGAERLSLDFGEVDTYVLLCETRGVNNPFHARNDIWYAPSIGWNVQFRYQESGGESYGWQAIEFIPPH
jgi:hypothetical protein